jgi:uncharacterized membrane protein YdjX (TVP38/TMEM64 family)
MLGCHAQAIVLSQGISRDKAACHGHCQLMRRFLPLLVLIVLAVAGFFLLRDLGWDRLARHQAELTAWVGRHKVMAAALYLLAYVLTAGLSLPHGAVLTTVGGLLFGAGFGCTLSVIGATVGASLLLLVIRSAFAQTLDRQRRRIPQSLQAKLARDGFSYLLALRLLPLVPFWMVNLAAAIVGIRLAVFVPATLLGIAPASFVLSSIGAGLGSILAEGRTPDLSLLFSAKVLLPLIGLAVLSLLPAVLRRRPGAHA